jgi:DNA-binding transcriptional MocR family regulator
MSSIKGSDLLVLGGLIAIDGDSWTYRSLADDLGVPHAVVQRALIRAGEAGLYSSERREVHLPNFEEFAVHALRYVAPGALGAIVPGVPAAWAAEPVAKAIRSSGDNLPPVWPSARGTVRGQSLEPLHPAAIAAAERWPEVGRLLAILDSLRTGDLRVREVAGRLLSEELQGRLAPHTR